MAAHGRFAPPPSYDLLSRNGTKTGRYVILAGEVTPGVWSVVSELLLTKKIQNKYI